MTDDLNAGARKLLNTHGYAYSQSLLRQLDSAYRSKDSPYRFVVSELPVNVGDRHTAVDLVLQNTQGWAQIVVGECKRVDPKHGRWLFARTPYTRARPRLGTFVSAVVWDGSAGRLKEQTHIVADVLPYHIGFEMKTDRPGDGIGREKSAIDAVVSQVFLATAGVMEYLKAEPKACLTDSLRSCFLSSLRRRSWWWSMTT